MTDFSDAVDNISDISCDPYTRLKEVKVMLDAAKNAYYNAISGGAVKDYKVNTGQTVIEVEVDSIASIRKIYENLQREYNELCAIYTGGNIMVMRDAGIIGGR